MCVIHIIVKYILEALAISVSVYIISRFTLPIKTIIELCISIACIFILFDITSPIIGKSLRLGTGFASGYSLIGGMDDPIAINYYSNMNPTQSQLNEDDEDSMRETPSLLKIKPNINRSYVSDDLIYSPLEPHYAFKSDFPENWGRLNQPNLYKTIENLHKQKRCHA